MEIKKNFDIKKLTTFKTGGIIETVFLPESVDEFVEILSQNPDIQVFGNLSNTLISSYGYDGKIILTNRINNIFIDGQRVVAGCGVKGPKLSQEVCKNGLSGLEFMVGFPGSVGGEVCMNASAHAQAISDKIKFVKCYDKGMKTFSKSEMGFEYRTSRCQKEGLVVLEVEFELEEKNPIEIQDKMNENLDFRKAHQPSLLLPNCGSIFKNPSEHSAGKLLDNVGAKDLSCGGVKVWENHANFIVNVNNGTSKDILKLMLEMQTRVKQNYNIHLEPEIKFLGGKDKEENELWYKLNKK
ncbi:UDP-N-acetylmuramate dehydrogenase [bacterium]|nr:UDP-N-acetylmuramate dehydrogenase [bacterium]